MKPTLSELKAARARNGMTQIEISEIIGMSNVTYSRKESGLREFSLSEAKHISDVLGGTIESIFFASEVNLK